MRFKLFIIAFIAVCLLDSCEKRRLSDDEFNLLWDQASITPKAVLDSVDSIENHLRSKEGSEDKIRLDFLRLRATDKAFIPHTTDSVINIVLEYYSKKRDRRMLPWAYYYAGRVNSDLGDALKAYEFFLTSLENTVPGKNKGTNNLRITLYSQISELFDKQGIYDKALIYEKAAIKEAESIPGEKALTRSLIKIGEYYGRNNLDSSIYFYKKGIESALNRGETYEVAVAKIDLARVYLKKGEKDMAAKMIREAKPFVEEVPFKYYCYYQLGIYYEKTHQPDSAIYYWNILAADGDLSDKRLANKYLAAHAIEDKDPEKALRYTTLRMIYNDSLMALNNAENILKMEKLYNYSIRERDNKKLTEDNYRKKIFLIILFSILFAGSVVAFVIVRFYKMRHHLISSKYNDLVLSANEKELVYEDRIKALEQEKNRIQSILNDIKKSDTQMDNDELKNAVEELNSKNEELERVKKQLLELKESMEHSSRVLGKSELIQKFYNIGRKSTTPLPSSEDWEKLENVMSKAYPLLMTALDKLAINQDERRLSMLIKLRIETTPMATIFSTSPQNISVKKRRLAQRALKKGGAASSKDWDEFIHSI